MIYSAFISVIITVTIGNYKAEALYVAKEMLRTGWRYLYGIYPSGYR